MDEVQTFTNDELGTVRTLNIDGQIWFVGKDVALALGYNNASKAVSVHTDVEDKREEVISHSQNENIGSQNGNIDSQNGNMSWHGSKTILINESGLYSLILSSKLPKAKVFKRWVTSDILPSLRRQGIYTLGVANIDAKERIQMARLVAFTPANRMAAVKKLLEPITGVLPLFEEPLKLKRTAGVTLNVGLVYEVADSLLQDDTAVVRQLDDNTYALDKKSFEKAMQRQGFSSAQALKVLDEAGRIKRSSEGKRTCPVYNNGKNSRCIILKTED